MSVRKTDRSKPEWTADKFRAARQAGELPADVLQTFPRTRGPQKAPTKEAVSLRLSPEVLKHFRATGKGWQTRIDETLVSAIRKVGRSR